MPFSEQQMQALNAIQRALKAKEQTPAPISEKKMDIKPAFPGDPEEVQNPIFPTPGPKAPVFPADQAIPEKQARAAALMQVMQTPPPMPQRAPEQVEPSAFEQDRSPQAAKQKAPAPEVYNATDDNEQPEDFQALRKMLRQ